MKRGGQGALAKIKTITMLAACWKQHELKAFACQVRQGMAMQSRVVLSRANFAYAPSY